jgi:hypothetical protein
LKEIALKSSSPNAQPTIYGLRAPAPFSRIRYIGSTRSALADRLKQHIGDARRGVRTRVYAWIRGLLEAGETPKIVPLEFLPPACTDAELRAPEARIIERWRQDGARVLNGSDPVTRKMSLRCRLQQAQGSRGGCREEKEGNEESQPSQALRAGPVNSTRRHLPPHLPRP